MRAGAALKDPVVWQGLSHRLGRSGWGRISLFVDYFVRWWFGCFLPGSATLGEGVKAGYGGIGIVVHKQARIGARTAGMPNSPVFSMVAP